MVGCWCLDNHNARYIAQQTWDVGNTEALVDRCDKVYSLARSWTKDTLDADEWLRRAGLPRRTRSTNIEA